MVCEMVEKRPFLEDGSQFGVSQAGIECDGPLALGHGCFYLSLKT
jgi:hypothetical protein